MKSCLGPKKPLGKWQLEVWARKAIRKSLWNEASGSTGDRVTLQEQVAVAGNASANDSDVRDVPSSAGVDTLFRMLTRGGLGKVNVSVELEGMDTNLSESLGLMTL